MSSDRVRHLMIFASLGIAACVASDDDGTTNATTVSTTGPSTTAPSDSSGDATTVTTASTTMAAETGSTGEECPADADCQVDTDCGTGGSCVACICVGGMDSTGGTGGDCPPDEMCVMTGAGSMACLAEPDHCTLACNDTMVCPDSMTCQNGACQYDLDNPPAEGDPNYPLPQQAMPSCPDGFTAVSFGPASGNFAVCSPACEGTGTDAMCPQGGSGTALGACLWSPDSSGMMCMG